MSFESNNEIPQADGTQKKALFVAFSITAMISIGVSSVAPALPLMGRYFAIDAITVSLVITAFTLPGLLFLPLVGYLADNYGRKIIVIPCLLGFALAGAGSALAPNFEVLLLCRALQGLFAAPFGMLCTTLLADFFQGPKLVKTVGLNGLIMNVSLAVTPAVGGLLAILNWRVVFILPLFALIPWLISLRLPMEKPASASKVGDYFKGIFKVLYNPKTIMLLSLGFFNLFMVFGPILSSYSGYADAKFGSPSDIIGYILASSSVTAAMTSIWAGIQLATRSPRQLLFIGQTMYAIALFLVPFMPGQWWLLLPVMLFGAGNGMCATTVVSTIIQQAPRESRGSLMSIYGISLCAAQTFGPFFCGVIGESFGLDAIYWVTAGISLVTLMGTALFRWTK